MATLRNMIMGSAILVSGCSTISPKLSNELAACSEHLSTPQIRAELSFENQSGANVEVNWVQVYSGDLVRYAELPPNASRPQRTYVGHLWAIRGADGQLIGSHCAGEGRTIVTIKPTSISVRPEVAQK